MNTTITTHGYKFILTAHDLGDDAQTAFDAIERELDACTDEAVAAFHADPASEALFDISNRGVIAATTDWREDWFKSGAAPAVDVEAA